MLIKHNGLYFLTGLHFPPHFLDTGARAGHDTEVTNYWLDEQGSLLSRERNVSLPARLHRLRDTMHPGQWGYGDIFSEIKQPEREADHLLLFSDEG